MKQYLPQQFDVKLRVFKEEPDFGKGVTQLLALIEQKGSLSAAYNEMGMAASKAWKILNRAEHDLGVRLVERKAGGKKGGYSALTPEGKDMMERYMAFQKEVEKAAQEAFHKYFREDKVER